MKKLILGLGNLLLADEGVGVHVAQHYWPVRASTTWLSWMSATRSSTRCRRSPRPTE